jgi:hypothetical protein
MNKNEVFRNFLKNPIIKEKMNLDYKLNSLDLYSPSPNRLIDVIKTTILNLDDEQDKDTVARKINLSFKRDII